MARRRRWLGTWGLVLAGCAARAPLALPPALPVGPTPATPVPPGPLAALAGAVASPAPTPTLPPPAPFPTFTPAPTPTPGLERPLPIDLKDELIPFVSNRRESGQGGFDVYIYDRTAHTVFAPPGANTPGDEFNPSLSNNNHWLVYSTTVGGDTDVWLFDMQTQLVDPLPTLNTADEDFSPTISSDGSTIACTSRVDGHDRLRLFDLRSQTTFIPAVVERLGGDVANPWLSNDGKWVAYSLVRPGHGRDIVLYDVVHAAVLEPPYLDTDADEDEPAFSPDGHELLFSTNRRGQFDVMLYDLRTFFVDPLVLANSAGCADLTPSFLGTTDHQVLFVSDRTGRDDRRLYVYNRATATLDTLPTAHELDHIDTFSAL